MGTYFLILKSYVYRIRHIIPKCNTLFKKGCVSAAEHNHHEGLFFQCLGVGVGGVVVGVDVAVGVSYGCGCTCEHGCGLSYGSGHGCGCGCGRGCGYGCACSRYFKLKYLVWVTHTNIRII